ncbi:MAG TPA: ABC transporter ATP-binding protein [Chitinophagaceae bacterium]|nr:ABC transporter ATP-binding protein [Chitinophagaceae bacterium]
MAVAIKVENISKIYRLGDIGTGTLSNDLKRWYALARGREDPILKIGEVNDRTVKGKTDVVWSLRNINFEIEQGEAIGIIGRNGAGKSTLLKILSRVTSPTTGRVMGEGRVASLLEVGTGFHPELTGRENIFLNGTILGMRKKEIKSKFDAIVDFSGVERYIDTPVKRYSSGMYIRLAFAVAAYLESEILIIDEVLAVGDAEFQKKCLGKISEVSKGEGRTVLFVSHNMAAVKTLCNNAMVLEHGLLKYSGNEANAVTYYLRGASEIQNCRLFGDEYNTEHFSLKEISLNPKNQTSDIALDEYHEIEINVKLDIKKEPERLHVTFVLNNEAGEPIFTFSHVSSYLRLKKGFNYLKCNLPKGYLNVGTYYLSFYLIQDSRETLFVEKDIISFNVQEGERNIGNWMGKEPGFIKPVFEWASLTD